VDPKIVLFECRKSRPPTGFDLRTVESVASCSSSYAIPVHKLQSFIVFKTFPFFIRLQITFKYSYFKIYYAGLAHSSGIVQCIPTNTKNVNCNAYLSKV
jgi:hypothetical protein